jgi:thiopurine S-methyltransferase
MRVRYVAHMAALMPPGGRVLLISYSYNQKETKGPPFSVPQQELELLFSESFRVEILSEEDVLRSHQGLAARGVTKLMEYAVLLTRK